MIPFPPDRVFPIMPQHVAALLFSVNQQDESPSDISLYICHPLSLCVLPIIQPHIFSGRQADTVLLLSHVPYITYDSALSQNTNRSI